jgi:hypothetical protein
MAKRIVELTITGLTNEEVEQSNEMDIKIQQALKSVGIVADVTDELCNELDEEDSSTEHSTD